METGIQYVLITGSFAALLAALVLSLIRLIRGPEQASMIIALDLVASIVMGTILLFAVITGQGIYIDVAIVISLISFMGTLAISNYLKEKQ
jgi:multicomponent Na+:H+ antiporter subunit F